MSVAHPMFGDLIVLSFYVAGALAAWFASRRCAVDPRTCSAWRWVAAGSFLLAAAVVSTIGYQLTAGAVPFPSIVDLCYLAFYPVCLIGILRFPARRESRHARVRLGLDAATIALAGGSIIWYLVLGPTVAAGGSNLQIRIVSGAYPTGDLLQIFAMARLLTRVQAPALRVPLRFFTGALVGGVVGDVLFGWLQFHPNTGALKAASFILALAAASSLLAGASQRRVLAVSGTWSGRTRSARRTSRPRDLVAVLRTLRRAWPARALAASSFVLLPAEPYDRGRSRDAPRRSTAARRAA